MSAESLILFFIVGAFLVGFAIVFAHFAAPNSTNPQKAEPYECGIPTEGLTWLQFNVGYYLFAIIFLVFDVESVFIFPWAVVMKELGMTAIGITDYNGMYGIIKFYQTAKDERIKPII